MARTPKSASRWHDQLRHLQRDCESASSREERGLLREAYRLVAEGRERPQALRPIGKQDFEKLLAFAAHESAAIGLLGPDANYMVSKGSSGVHFATVVLDGFTEASAVAETFGLALVAALSCALRGDTPCQSANERVSAHQ